MKAFKPLVSVDLPLHTNIPPKYVPDRAVRLGLYRRLADTQNLDEVDALVSEFTDRFGPPPEQVKNIFFQMKVKILATRAGFSSVSVENSQLVMRYSKGENPASLEFSDPNIRIGKTALWVNLPSDFQAWSALLLDILTRYKKIIGHKVDTPAS